ncbi:hypothetical protein J2S78_000465 [Salibacterium salarium]|nr:hypothetical protein [Salibacterium salarium]
MPAAIFLCIAFVLTIVEGIQVVDFPYYMTI